MKKLKFYNEGWGRRIQIDLGDERNHYIDVGAQTNKYSIVNNIDTLILSHFHQDHFRSFRSFRDVNSKFYYNSYGFTLNCIVAELSNINNLRRFLSRVLSSRVTCIECWAGQTIRITGDSDIELLVHHPCRPNQFENEDLVSQVTYELDRTIRNLIETGAQIEQYFALANEYSTRIVNLVDERQQVNSNRDMPEDQDTPIQRVRKYIYLEIILKMLCYDNVNYELITSLFDLTRIRKSASYLRFFKQAKTVFKNAHEYNIVLTTQNQTVYLPGDIHSSKVNTFDPQINFSNVRVFEMPHHGSNENIYWNNNYANVGVGTIFVRSYAYWRRRNSYSPNINRAIIHENFNVSVLMLGHMHCTSRLTHLDDFIQIPLI